MIASMRIGARRQGNRSSSPAQSTTSALMSDRATSGENVRQACALRPGVTVALVPIPYRTNTATDSPTSGATMMNQVSWTATKSIPALSTSVTPTTKNPPTNPPSKAPKAAVPRLDKRAPAPVAPRPAASGAPPR